MNGNVTERTTQFPLIGSIVLYHEEMQGELKTSVAIVDKVLIQGLSEGKLALTVFTPELEVRAGNYRSVPFAATPRSGHWTWRPDLSARR